MSYGSGNWAGPKITARIVRFGEFGAGDGDEWFPAPGAGDTQCLFGCRCKFVAVKSGVTMADPIERRAA